MRVTSEQVQNLKQELKALLEKYHVAIGFELADGSDTHRLYGERMVVSGGRWRDEELFSVNGWSIEAEDLCE